MNFIFKMLMLFLASCLCFLNCSDNKKPNSPTQEAITQLDTSSIQDTFKKQSNVLNTIETRISTPSGYQRNKVSKNSFQEYLRTLKLKPKGSLVTYYTGTKKSNNGVYTDVVDLEIGKKDLHQCADAVMRLKAEYLWKQKRYNDIHFNFTNGHKVAYSEWMKGKRMKVDGNKTTWVQTTTPSNSYEDFWEYLELVFMYAGTASLEKELNKVDIKQAEIGDILIQGGFPGHAVIIVDKATNSQTGKAIFLLAQSYMPAQEIQVLQNPNDGELSPWIALNKGEINTPEWSFNSSDLKRFPY